MQPLRRNGRTLLPSPGCGFRRLEGSLGQLSGSAFLAGWAWEVSLPLCSHRLGLLLQGRTLGRSKGPRARARIPPHPSYSAVWGVCLPTAARCPSPFGSGRGGKA